MAENEQSEDTVRQADYIDKQIGRLRQWFAGFEAAGGKPPHDLDALRKAQLFILASANETEAPND